MEVPFVTEGSRVVPAETVHAVKNVGSGNAAELATYFVDKDKPSSVGLHSEVARRLKRREGS
jgi:hypothetical protein